MIDAQDIHARLGAEGWRQVLATLGVHERFLVNRHGPCPACGGKDRFRFDNKRRGSFFCNNCGAGDGFKLVMRVREVTFAEARRLVMKAGGIEKYDDAPIAPAPLHDEPPARAEPTRRVSALLRESCAIEDCEPAVTYLASRKLWPLPAGHRLRAHTSIEYWHERQRVGRFPGLVTAVRDAVQDLVTVHVTYLTPEGTKLAQHEPRKLLSPLVGREGCAAPILSVPGDTLGIAEGIETALSASKLTGIPCWSAISSALLAKFEPPPDVARLVIFADRDVGGLEAATLLMQRLQDRVRLEIRTPPKGDWNDVLQRSQ